MGKIYFFIITFMCLYTAMSIIAHPATAKEESSISENGIFSEAGETAEDSIPFYADIMATSSVGSQHVSLSKKKYYHNTYRAGIIFIGATGLLALFILLLFIKSRDNIYIYYFLFLICSILGTVINMNSYRWDSWTFQPGSGMDKRNLEALTLLALFAYCVFTLKLLDVKKQEPQLAKWITVLAGLNVVYAILYWIFYPLIAEKEDLFFIASRAIILPMSLVAIVWVSYKVHSVFKGYFIIGSAFYFTGALLAVLRQTKANVPIDQFYDISSSTYFHGGIFLETVCFALALSHRIFLLYEAKQEEQKDIKEKAIKERDLARAQLLVSRLQINPHFIFNCLNAINLLVQKQEHKKASQYLVTFSRFIRMVLEMPKNETISLSEELQLIRYYLQLEAKRFDDDFTYQIHADSDYGLSYIKIPPLLLQPFIENAIWHGLLPSEKPEKKLDIHILSDDTSARIVIEDNGIGRKNKAAESQQDIPYKKSLGMKITKERIQQFNQSYNCQISLKIIDKEENGGTKVLLDIENTRSPVTQQL